MQSYMIALLAFLLSSVKGQATGLIFSKSAATGQCLSSLNEDVGVVLGNGDHTIQMRLTFPQDDPMSRQWLLNLGQRSTASHHWIWNSPTFVQFGSWNGYQIQNVEISKCTDLTTTYNGSVLKLFCDGAYMAQVNTNINILNSNLDIGQAVTEANFAGCISEVKIWSVEKSAAEVALHRTCMTARAGGIQNQQGRQDHPGFDSDDHCQSECDLRSDCKFWMRTGTTCYTYTSGTIDETSAWALGHRYGGKCSHKYVLGTLGGTGCPAGYEIVTDAKECEEAVPGTLTWNGSNQSGDFTFGSKSCRSDWLQARGCFTNKHHYEQFASHKAGVHVFFNTCQGTTTPSWHQPICKPITNDECGLHQHSVCTSYPCIDLREGSDHHHIMVLDHSDKTKAKITYFNQNWQAGSTWDCSRLSTDYSLIGDWSCGNFYVSGAITISSDYADDFTNQRTNDHIDFCKEDGALTQDCRWETAHDQQPNSANYMGWTCADDEILTGLGLSPNQHDVTKVQCCKLGGHSAVKSNTCSYVDSNHQSAVCGDGNDHMVFSGAYDKRAASVDAVTEILAGKCCEVECDAAWCAGGNWGVDKNNCQDISTQNTGAQELVCPTGTLMTEIEDGLAGNAHGVQKVGSVTCCAMDLISQPTMAPSSAPTTSRPTTAPSSAPTTSRPTTAPSSAPSVSPTAAPTTVVQCLLSLRDSSLTDAQYLADIDLCLPGCRSTPQRRLLSENRRRQ